MTICNLCGGKVEYIPNSLIFGRSYGSGYCYRCTYCGAYVGTHKTNPKKPLGILADEEMRQLRRQCHSLFDAKWINPKERRKAYQKLAEMMGIPLEDCHFAKFNKEQLKLALSLLGKENKDA